MAQTKRIEWIDLLRVFAVSVVLLIHAAERVYSFNLDYMDSIPVFSKIIAFTMFTLGRLGVPVFLMISGYLLLDREYDEVRTKRFWTKNCLHLFICTEIWLLIYEVFCRVYEGKGGSIPQIIADMLFVHEPKASHLWYMPMILGFYILIPLVANGLRKFDIKFLVFPIIIYSAFSFIYPEFKIACDLLMDEKMTRKMSLGFSGGYYGVFLLMGYFIKKGGLKKIRSWILMVFGTAFFAMGVGFQLWAYQNHYRYNIWYESLFIFVASVAIFELVSRISRVPGYKAVKWLSAYSFPVYLIHNIFRIVLVDYINTVSMGRVGKTLLLWIAATALSYGAVWLVARIPKVGKYILYMK